MQKGGKNERKYERIDEGNIQFQYLALKRTTNYQAKRI